MTIELPKKFNYGNQVKIQDGILKIPSGLCWRDFMYALATACKGKKCYYCGEKLRNSDITMDHLYPQDLGGPTITNNLAPTCADCNNKKGNLTEKQFRNLVKAKDWKKKTIKNRFFDTNEGKKIKKGYYLPREWITSRRLDSIIVCLMLEQSYRGKKYNKIEVFYSTYGHLPYPIVVDKNNYLLDGFLIAMFAKNNNIARVPAIVLDNVEVIINK